VRLSPEPSARKGVPFPHPGTIALRINLDPPTRSHKLGDRRARERLRDSAGAAKGKSDGGVIPFVVTRPRWSNGLRVSPPEPQSGRAYAILKPEVALALPHLVSVTPSTDCQTRSHKPGESEAQRGHLAASTAPGHAPKFKRQGDQRRDAEHEEHRSRKVVEWFHGCLR
jgi:hypothetical protein